MRCFWQFALAREDKIVVGTFRVIVEKRFSEYFSKAMV